MDIVHVILKYLDIFDSKVGEFPPTDKLHISKTFAVFVVAEKYSSNDLKDATAITMLSARSSILQ